MNFEHMFLDFSGKISRAQFIIGHVLLILVCLPFIFFFRISEGYICSMDMEIMTGKVYFGALALTIFIVLVMWLALVQKRVADRRRHGAYTLVFLLPIVALGISHMFSPFTCNVTLSQFFPVILVSVPILALYFVDLVVLGSHQRKVAKQPLDQSDIHPINIAPERMKPKNPSA